jgi:hypothetical protein
MIFHSGWNFLTAAVARTMGNKHTERKKNMSDAKTKPYIMGGGAPGITMIMNIKPGNTEKVRNELLSLFRDKFEVANEAIEGVGTIQYARWLLLDNGTKLSYVVVFDGEFDKYWDDFMVYFKKAGLFPVFALMEGFPEGGMRDMTLFKKFARENNIEPFMEYGAFNGASRVEIRKAIKVQEAFQKVLDNPAAAKALKDPALKPLLDVASA